MKVDISGVEQLFDFRTKKLVSYVLIVAGDSTVRAIIDDLEDVEAIVAAGLEEEEAEIDNKIGWSQADIPDEIKAQLLSLSVPAKIDEYTLSALVTCITRNILLTRELEKKSENSVSVAAAPDAPSHRPLATKARSVPKDDMGYPIVPKADNSVKAVIADSSDYDEDGVGQL